MRSVQENQQNGIYSILRPVLLGIVGGLVVSVLMLCIFSAVFASNDMPQAAIMPMACFSIAAGAFTGGFISAKIFRSKGFITGAITGIIMFVILYITGALMHQIDLGTLAFIKFLISLLAGLIGGISGVNTGVKRSRP